MEKHLVGRRGILATTGLAAAAGVLAMAPGAQAATSADASTIPAPKNMPLAFNADGKFKIVQFNDTQDGRLTDRRTVELMEKVLDTEKPGFVVINGDVINGSPRNAKEVKEAYNNVVLPMETRGIKWAVTFGNHDEDSLSNQTGMREEEILAFVQQYKHNLNPAPIKGVYGHSNAQLLIRSASKNTAAFGIWLLDSNRYAPDTLGGQNFDGLMGYDWIRPNQIQWYTEASEATEQKFGKKIQSLMFFHIPTFEHHHMWFGQQFSSDEAGVAAAKVKHSIEGEKHEEVYTGAFNSGIYAAAQERGDVRGMYCGHDHINTYKGDYFGIELGYGPGTGYGTYGLGGVENHRLRGARVFELDESVATVYAGTRTVFAKDLGVDTTNGDQRLTAPVAFPSYVK